MPILTCARLHGAALLYNSGEYEEATPYLIWSLELREKTVGCDHLDVAQSLNNLAVLRNNQGQYEEARRLHERSLRIREKVRLCAPPKCMVPVRLLLSNTPHLSCVVCGHMVAALRGGSLMRRSQVLGPSHPNVATSLNNLGELLRKQGFFAQAEPLYQVMIPLAPPLPPPRNSARC